MEGYKAGKYLDTNEQSSGKKETRSLRKWPYRERSNPTREMEGHPSRSDLDPAAQGSSNGSSRMMRSQCWKGESRLNQS